MNDKETTIRYLTAQAEYHQKKVEYLTGEKNRDERIKHWNAMCVFQNAINELKK